uniref:Microbial-type PARG catalytic domain-containing protein n=1 Tax=Haptolina brevifila TaxID=156173 RepID=A0A6U7C9M9_9EUKA|mmetsp:Transcript_15160/g.30414  ORF Transcript_15160/g.30414 Transcript_15160/m.30414 type:complete len:303 (+) Transcript_15160:44-952(+)|eukprot:CAMPEP_0174720898 /NCGR_PEP_ID=MMETSP1094-20130205/34797_1 /TAXON_ID=156173 /ORGANISM="Chrysochromulina brevifilum, Strain UTEX LB 985" /LENGTH=302 /DNA_ID=CAMNT_0015921479 /DNA_START=44 /DNA_END=952 /DNA_ORIENTATION=-
MVATRSQTAAPKLLAANFGRVLPSAGGYFGGDAESIRTNVLLTTLSRLEDASSDSRYHQLAQANLQRWAAAAAPTPDTAGRCKVVVLPGDWGDVTLAMTKQYGKTFASLNMANAWCPGGGYVEGMVAQEENMFRRTDCHFSIERAHMGKDGLYLPSHTKELNAEAGTVYLDTARPRVCIRGPEDRKKSDLGYPWLADEEIFPFYELRAAAKDLRDGSSYDHADTLRRIHAQLETLRAAGVRHAVLSAFGCGAFCNPAHHVAEAYKEALSSRADQFDVIAFAIFHAGYGPDNHTPFAHTFANW